MSKIVLHQNSGGAVGFNQPRQGYYANNPAPSVEQSSAGDLLRMLYRHRKLMLIIVGVVTLATLLYQLTRPTLYRATASMQVELIDAVGINQADIQARNNQRIANEVKLHGSQASAERVVRDLELYDQNDFAKDAGGKFSGGKKKKVRAAAMVLMDMVDITFEEGSDLMDITVESQSPELAALIANQYPQSVRSLRIKKATERREELLASLLQKQRESAVIAATSSKAVADFRIANGMLSGAGGAEDAAYVSRIASEAISAAALRAGGASRSSGMAGAAGIRSVAGATNASVQQLERQEADLSAQMASISETFGSGHPDYMRTSASLNQVKRDLAQERARATADAAAVASAEGSRMAQIARSEAAGDAARAGQLQAQLGMATRKAFNNIGNLVELEQLSREADLAAKAFNQITERVTEIRAQNDAEGVNSSVVSPAAVDNRAVAPTPVKMTLLAMMASSILAFLVAFTLDLFDDKLRTSTQIRRLFGLPTFGSLPIIKDAFVNKIEESPVLQKPQSLFSEVARSSYFEIDSLVDDNEPQTVLVTSPLPGDGKSVVSVTLAAAALAAGKRVAVLDLDLRKTGLIQALRNADTPDLIEVLKGRVDFNKIAHPALPAPHDFDDEVLGTRTGSDTGKIALISASTPVAEPGVLLGSRALQTLLGDLKAEFDFVVINAPATLAVKDAKTMCSFADNTVVVARWGRTTIGQMRATLEILNTDNVAGVIFDQVDYEEHARRRYGDAIQYYFEAADYYSDPMPSRWGRFAKLRALFDRKRRYAA